MSVQVVIDAIVRQTTVLIAELATAGGVRAPLSHVADQVFLDLAAELERQGVSRRVCADMFGIALRSYQRKIARLRESSTQQGRTLWEAVYDFVVQRGLVTRAEILRRFEKDEPELVTGILRDLSGTGVVFASGRGPGTAYRAVTRDELDQLAPEDEATIDSLLWTIVYREGPIARAALLRRARFGEGVLDAALARLGGAGRIERTEGEEPLFSAAKLVIFSDQGAGWEAAVLDHFLALVRTIVAKLHPDPALAEEPDTTGGSTYTFVVSPGHPEFEAVVGELSAFRKRRSALRARVDAYNAEHGIPPSHRKVLSYCGQSMTVEDAAEDVER